MKKIDLILILLAITFCAFLLIMNFTGAILETGSWGLSFSEENQPPVGPDSKDQLEKFGGYYLGNTQDKTIYLTFDSGYENGCTGKILDTLKKHNVPAAFFLVGHYVEKNPDLVRRMTEEGHLVCNHTMHHPDMSKIQEFESFQKELTDLENLYQEKTGKSISRFYRPPQGIYSQENLEMAEKMGYKTIFWSLAYADWDNQNQPDPQQAVEKLTKRIHNGAIVLLHSTSNTNAQILDRLLSKWEEMGYQFAPLTDLP